MSNLCQSCPQVCEDMCEARTEEIEQDVYGWRVKQGLFTQEEADALFIPVVDEHWNPL